jgi:hypothetical protein
MHMAHACGVMLCESPSDHWVETDAADSASHPRR